MTCKLRLSIVGAATVAATVGAVVSPAAHGTSPTAAPKALATSASLMAAPPRLEAMTRPLPRPASRSRALPPKPRPTTAAARTVAPSRSAASHRPSSGCTSANWRSLLSGDELWIDLKESGLDPLSQNPHSTASGLGQLLDSTYRSIGMTPDSDPCHQITAQRRYMSQTYGSWAKARAFWEARSYW